MPRRHKESDNAEGIAERGIDLLRTPAGRHGHGDNGKAVRELRRNVVSKALETWLHIGLARFADDKREA
jgi:hypothetical protein